MATKRQVLTELPVTAIIGKMGGGQSKWGAEYNKLGFYVGYKRWYGNKNMFQARVNYRSTAPNANELAAREKFRIVAQAARREMADTTQQQYRNAYYRRQTKNPTMYGMVFSHAWELYEDGQVVFPANYWQSLL